MAVVKKPRGRIWENTETSLLLQKWGDENIQLKLKSCTRKKPIWLEISAFLRAAGYEDRDEETCKTRIHTLISAYRAYKDECAKTGNATPKKKPAFFDEVEELLSEKPCTRPKIVINSSQIVANSLETVESEDDHDENSEPNISSTITINASCSTSNEPNKDDVTGKPLIKLLPIGQPNNGLDEKCYQFASVAKYIDRFVSVPGFLL